MQVLQMEFAGGGEGVLVRGDDGRYWIDTARVWCATCGFRIDDGCSCQRVVHISTSLFPPGSQPSFEICINCNSIRISYQLTCGPIFIPHDDRPSFHHLLEPLHRSPPPPSITSHTPSQGNLLSDHFTVSKQRLASASPPKPSIKWVPLACR